jgi:hypothetical protein
MILIDLKRFLIFCFMHGRQWVMKSTKTMDMYMCVDVVVHFAMGLGTNDT